MDIRLGARVTGKAGKDSVTIQYTDAEGEQELSVNKLIVSVGRRPFTTNVLAQDAGVELNERGLWLWMDNVETAVAGVYAVGDGYEDRMLRRIKARKRGWVAS